MRRGFSSQCLTRRRRALSADQVFQFTGNTLLHHAAANCDADTILKILQKGADVTLENSTTTYDMESEGCNPDRSYELPLEVAIQQKRSELN